MSSRQLSPRISVTQSWQTALYDQYRSFIHTSVVAAGLVLIVNTFRKVIGKNVEKQKCRIDIFSFFCGQGKNVELEKILQFDIFVVKFEKGKNVELYILKGKNVELKF